MLQSTQPSHIKQATPEDWIAESADLVSLPDVYVRIKAVIDNPKASMADLGEVISYDPGLSARILRIANSAFFGFASKISSISRAVSLLGTQHVHDLVLATVVTRTFSGMPGDVVSMDLFWRNSVFCGVACRALAARCNVLDSARLFLEGLLYDVGHLVLYRKMPGLALEAIARSKDSGQPVHLIEQELIGFDYAQLGGALLQSWQLPANLVKPIRYHLHPADTKDYSLEASLVHIASVLAQTLAAADDSLATAAIDPKAWEVTDLTEDALHAVRTESAEQVAEVISLFFGNASP